jgi:hypothetical protein
LIPEKNNQGALQFLIQLNGSVEYPKDPEIDDNWTSNVIIMEMEVNDQGEFGKYNSHATTWKDFGNSREYSALYLEISRAKAFVLEHPKR